MIENLSPLQAKLLELLKWFDQLCRDNNLRYYAIGGTVLGAMRHQGFIPWDDDIDVGMPRSDFEKLKHLAKLEQGRFRIETYDSEADDYYYAFNKLYDTTTTLIEHKRVDVIRGVFIDIFPLDGVGDTLEEGIIYYKKFRKKSQFFETMVSGVRKGRSWIKNLAVVMCGFIPRFLVNPRVLRIRLNKSCSAKDFDNCKYGGNLFGAYWGREILDLSLFGTPRDYLFEDMMIAGPEDADGYLTHIYHNWRQLPPKDKQITHHDFKYLNLNESYLDRITR